MTDKELKSTIDILCNKTTYVSKKMNPTRRALIIKNIIGKMGVNDLSLIHI